MEIAGKLQHAGPDAKGEVLRTDFSSDTDTLELDLTSAYRVPELKQLKRTFTFDQKAAKVVARDAVAFTTPQTFETALITWGQWKQISERELSISDGKDMVHVAIDTGGLAFKIRSETLDEDVTTTRKPVRLALTLSVPAEQILVTLVITPDPAKADR